MSKTSLTISLAIVLVITRSQASGFAIRKADNWDSTTDLDTGGSSLLEVRYDLKDATAMKALHSPTNGEIETAVMKFSKANDSDHSNNTESTTNGTTAIQDNYKKMKQEVVNNVIHEDANTIYTSVDLSSSTVETTTEQNVSTLSISSSESAITSEKSIDFYNKSTTPLSNENSTQQTFPNVSKTTETTSFTSSPDNATIILHDYNMKNLSIEYTTYTDVPNSTETLENNDTQSTTDIIESRILPEKLDDITEAESFLVGNEDGVALSEAEIDSETTTETSSVPITTPKKAEVEALTTATLLSSYQRQPNIDTDPSIETVTNNRELNTINVVIDTTGHTYTDPSITTETQTVTINTNTLQDEIMTTLPSWKIYKTINRKRPSATSIEETTSSDIEMTKAETARISLERVLNNTPIPSLLELKNDFLNAQNYSTRRGSFDVTSASGLNERHISSLSTTLSTQQMITEDLSTTTHTPKLEIVSSKRAGYLVNQETTTTEPTLLATAVVYEDKGVSNDTDNFGIMYESEINDEDGGYLHGINNSTAAESQSQLVEDAMKEELLMEKTLHENNLLKEEAQQRDLRPELSEKHQAQDEHVTLEALTEDTLSVKPIGLDKRKNNSIYVTSSVNYKPLKKLDVQHAKQFVRDPDDNSWRNESISSLGIVFKPKNASKSFTEVLKNKTTELSNIVDKVDKGNVPDLRVRLEKIAEVRKSKKKRINKFGDTVYSDYEENSGESANASKEDTTSPIVPSQKQDVTSTTPLTPAKTDTDLTINAVWKDKINLFQDDVSTTEKLKKFYNLADYYDATDDYDADYFTLSKIDLKRFTVPYKTSIETTMHPQDTFPTRPAEQTPTNPTRVTYTPDRQPTIQYFPPTKKVTTTPSPKASSPKVNDYDDRFTKKLNVYEYKEAPKVGYDFTYATASPVQTKKMEHPTIITPKPVYTSTYQANTDKSAFLTSRPRITEPEPQGGFVPIDGTLNRASYVIKHYKDFINDAAKNDDDKMVDYLPFTEAPVRGVTMGEISNFSEKEAMPVEDYDYDSNFRKDIVNRFVENFNQNSERFKVDFPIIYNNSVVHRKEEQNGKVLASSSAFMKRLYETANPRSQFLMNIKPCNGNCEAMAVDLSPAYELHYYVPDQEEKEEIESRPNTLPYRPYRL